MQKRSYWYKQHKIPKIYKSYLEVKLFKTKLERKEDKKRFKHL